MWIVPCTICQASPPSVCQSCAKGELYATGPARDIILFLTQVISGKFISAQDAFEAMRKKGLVGKAPQP